MTEERLTEPVRAAVVPDGTASASAWVSALASASVSAIGLGEGETLLVLGAGAGLDALLDSARRVGPSGRVIALDSSGEPPAPAAAPAPAPAVGAGVAQNVELLHGRADAVPLPDACVDVVLAVGIPPWVAGECAVFAEVARLLRPGGRLFVGELLATDGSADGPPDAERCTDPRERYQAALADVGMHGVEVLPTRTAGGPGETCAAVRARKPAVLVAPMTAAHAGAVLEIFQAGIDGGDATFETAPPTWEDFDRSKLPGHRYVALDPGTDRVVGWATTATVSARCAYRGVVEHSVYVHPDARGRGAATALLHTLVMSTEAAGIWTIQSGIFPENKASLALHERAGFRVIGTRERIGCHHGRWRDVVLVERRSRRVGVVAGWPALS